MPRRLLDLSPAKWIWLPSQRTLANTFVLFRKTVTLAEVPKVATGWIAADSRYRLFVNGVRVQWGPAPHDPRHAEADPLDLAKYLRAGENLIAVEVLFYGHGDGTWPFGKPGLLVSLHIDGMRVVSDASWRCDVDRGHRPGQFKRWYLRALQEEFDARWHPVGWTESNFDDARWLFAQEFRNPPDRAAFAGGYSDYLNEVWMTSPELATLGERSIPMLREEWIAAKPTHSGEVLWSRDADDWFQFRVPGSFVISNNGPVAAAESLSVPEGPPGVGHYLTYELSEGVVGWPSFRIDAPEGTVVELMVHEVHDPVGHPWMDSHFYEWTRFTCREGTQVFQTFDYEALKWIQLHVHGNSRPVRIDRVGVLRRTFPWPHAPQFAVDEEPLQKLFLAGVNTLNNSAQDICVDGMARERQQYSGDGGHQLHAVRYAFGEHRLPDRFLRTFAHGQLLDGVWLDSWPAYDRLARIWERNVGATGWGSLVDHSVGFCFDHFHHWMQTGDIAPVRDHWTQFMRFVEYLRTIRLDDGMLPVEGLGQNAVWIDHEAFRKQADKRCAFNLYSSAMVLHALVPMAREVAPSDVPALESFAESLLVATRSAYWDAAHRSFRSTRHDEALRFDDRSLATAVLYDLADDTSAMVELLANPTGEVGLSYPANMVWPYWALIKAGRIGPVLKELRERWATMRSVRENNTLQEFWTVRSDEPNLMSHCPLAPLLVLYQGILGLNPLSPGFRRMEIRPQPGDLERVEVTAYVPHGAVHMSYDRGRLRLLVPTGVEAVAIWQGETYRLAAGVENLIG